MDKSDWQWLIGILVQLVIVWWQDHRMKKPSKRNKRYERKSR